VRNLLPRLFLALTLIFALPALAGQPAPVITLTASPASVAYNGASVIYWSVSRAQSCVASGAWSGTKPTSGTFNTGPLTAASTFTLTCSNKGGSTTKSVAVSVGAAPPPPPPAPTSTLSASPSSIAYGATTTLSWSSTNATSCQASGAWTGLKALSGSEVSMMLTVNSTFVLTCTGAGGSITKSVAVTVGAPPPPPPATAALSWDASPSVEVVGYRVYWGTAPGAYIQAPGQGLFVGNVTTYTVLGLTSGLTYYFVVRAVDGISNESVPSNEASKTMP
jgi:hypothetical protein